MTTLVEHERSRRGTWPLRPGAAISGLLIQCGGADINYAANVACLKVKRDQQYTSHV